jgi:hypothetical protein
MAADGSYLSYIGEPKAKNAKCRALLAGTLTGAARRARSRRGLPSARLRRRGEVITAEFVVVAISSPNGASTVR